MRQSGQPREPRSRESVKRRGNYDERFMAPIAMKFQFNMVVLIDDTAHFKKEELKHKQFKRL